MQVIKDFFASLGLLGWAIILLALAGGAHIAVVQVYGPWYEQVRFNIWQESQAYRGGNVRELYNWKMQWDVAAPGSDVRKTAKAAVLQFASTIRDQDVPSDINSWLQDLRAGRIN